MESNKAQLIYINETFMRFLGNESQSEKAQRVLSRAIFYDDVTKLWGNPYALDARSTLDFLKTQGEFNERKWILLKKNTNPDLNEKYMQEGPYSSKEIFEMLQNSQVRLSDPIWKEGLSKWTLIRNTQTFKELETLSKSLEPDVAELLANVVEYNPEMHRVENKDVPDTPDVFVILDDK